MVPKVDKGSKKFIGVKEFKYSWHLKCTERQSLIPLKRYDRHAQDKHQIKMHLFTIDTKVPSSKVLSLQGMRS